MIGSVLGHYRVTATLGAGGMGEVYRATDTRLDREVAIKVLPAAFTADPERLARFAREAKLLAQLHHPNIASVFGLEESNGTRALVMELVEGEDLAARIARGPLPLEDALAIARQIAEALEAAHEQGIVHRDLKPANVIVRADGTVKVLDFGLAKAMEAAAPAPGADVARSPTLMRSPTLTAVHGTELGVILGTAAYMAPEQARGVATDKRVDVWGFGVVLWEMLTGHRLFDGELVTDVLADVLRKPIESGALPAGTPAAIRELLRRCLERNPKNRLHDVADARLVIDDVLAGEGGAEPIARVAPPARGVSRRELAAWATALLGVAAAVALLVARAAPPPPAVAVRPSEVTRFTVTPIAAGEVQAYPALSPDGRTLLYSLRQEDGSTVLWTHSFATGTARRLAGTEGGDEPFWSPDGRQVGFLAAGHLKRLDVGSGLVESLLRVADARGTTWTEGGDILLSPNAAAAIFRLERGASELRPVTVLAPERGEQSHRYPWSLPGGALLYTKTGSAEVAGIYWRSADGKAQRRLLPFVSRALFDGRGFLLWVRDGALLAQRFDPHRGELAGTTLPLAESVGGDSQKDGQWWIASSAAGTAAYRRGSRRPTELVWYGRDGEPLEKLSPPGNLREPALSSDGRHVAVSFGAADEGAQIWIFEATGFDRSRRLTFSRDSVETPTFSPDGRWIAYSSPRANGYALLRKPADGAGEEELLHEPGEPSWIDGWSPDGKRVVFERFAAERGSDLWLLAVDGERKAVPLLESPANENHAAFSPDGRLIAYASDDAGVGQVYVQTVPASGSRWQISRNGGDWPAWSADGKELYFAGLDRVLYAVPIHSLQPFALGAPEPLFRLRTPVPAVTSNRTFYAPAADGRRFLVNQLVGEAEPPGIEVVLGWSPAVEEP